MTDYSEGLRRLVPNVSHPHMETQRHYRAYDWFVDAIKHDVAHNLPKNLKTIRVLDAGCGVGYAAPRFAAIPGVSYVGVDNSRLAIIYAEAHYAGENIEFVEADITDYLEDAKPFDYVIGRHLLQAVTDGLSLLKQFQWKRRMFQAVPYMEPDDNDKHSVLTGINELWFNDPMADEFVYQDRNGRVHNNSHKPARPISMVAVYNAAKLPTIDPEVKRGA